MKLMGIGVFLIGVGVTTMAIVKVVLLVEQTSKKIPTGAPAGQFEGWDDWEDY